MTSLPRDANRVPVVGGVLSSDGVTPTPMEVDPDGNVRVIDSSTPTAGNNPSDTITEATVGTVTTTTIERVIGATTYTKTVVEDSSTGITTVSEWS